jgi:hypothetical protein
MTNREIAEAAQKLRDDLIHCQGPSLDRLTDRRAPLLTIAREIKAIRREFSDVKHDGLRLSATTGKITCVNRTIGAWADIGRWRLELNPFGRGEVEPNRLGMHIWDYPWYCLWMRPLDGGYHPHISRDCYGGAPKRIFSSLVQQGLVYELFLAGRQFLSNAHYELKGAMGVAVCRACGDVEGVFRCQSCSRAYCRDCQSGGDYCDYCAEVRQLQPQVVT